MNVIKSLTPILALVVFSSGFNYERKLERIVGGHTARNRTEFPYIVSIRKDNEHVCGGSIIDTRHVLTAAHCVVDGSSVLKSTEFLLEVGSLHLREREAIIYKVKHIFVHEKYNDRTVEHDIAILRIYGEFHFNQIINAIPLNSLKYVERTECVISGWGFASYDGDITDQLKFAKVRIISRKECNKGYAHDGDVFPNMICAGNMDGGVDGCLGDSGGPLICNNTLTGIISWGAMECGKYNQPGVYTEILTYTKWIQSQVIRSAAANKQLSISLLLLITIISTFNAIIK